MKSVQLRNIFHSIAAPFAARHYAMYPKEYVEPIIEKNEVSEFVQEKKKDYIQTMFIKAPKAYQTCSVFYDPDVEIMIRLMMKKGNKVLAKYMFDKTFETIKRIQLDKYYAATDDKKDEVILSPREIFHKAVENCTPSVKTKKVKRSGTYYTIPTMIFPKEAKHFSMKFLIDAALSKPKHITFSDEFAEEIIKASESTGKAFQKKVDLHKYCQANQAYAHYRWT